MTPLQNNIIVRMPFIFKQIRKVVIFFIIFLFQYLWIVHGLWLGLGLGIGLGLGLDPRGTFRILPIAELFLNCS